MGSMRWVAAIVWAGAAAFAFSQFLANEFPMIPNDLGPTAICLAAAGLLAMGGRIGLIAATLSVWLGVPVTIIFALLAIDGFGNWPVTAGAATLTVANYLAVRQKPVPPAE